LLIAPQPETQRIDASHTGVAPLHVTPQAAQFCGVPSGASQPSSPLLLQSAKPETQR
jgi:hypothetical protein